MARSKRMSVQKRLREKKKAEEAALKREMRAQRKGEPETTEPGNTVANREDLEGYGVYTPETDGEAT